jgi:hypothetical protein
VPQTGYDQYRLAATTDSAIESENAHRNRDGLTGALRRAKGFRCLCVRASRLRISSNMEIGLHT